MLSLLVRDECASAYAAPRLRRLSLSYEPGLGTIQYLSGLDVSPIPTNSTSVDAEEQKCWSYGASRKEAVDLLLGVWLEDFMVGDVDQCRHLRERFSALRTLTLRVWDTDQGEDDAWWVAEVSKRLPTLHRLGLLRLQCMRDCECTLSELS